MIDFSWLLLMMLRCVIAVVFIYYGFLKLLVSKRDFAKSISAYNLVPVRFVYPIALILPTVEFGLGLMFLFDIAFVVTYLGLIILLALFQIAIGRALVKNLDISCGCKGSSAEAGLSLKYSFTRNWFMLVLLLMIGILEVENVRSLNLTGEVAVIVLLIPFSLLVAQAITRKVANFQFSQSASGITDGFRISRRGFSRLVVGLVGLTAGVGTLESASADVDCAPYNCACNPITNGPYCNCSACDCAAHPNSDCYCVVYNIVVVQCCGGGNYGRTCGYYRNPTGGGQFCVHCP